MTLGLMLDVGDFETLRERVSAAAGAGYRHVQVFYRGEDLDAALARDVRALLDDHGLGLAAVGAYLNALQPADAPMGVTLERVQAIVDLLPVLGSRTIIAWSGTFSEQHVFQYDVLNRRPEAFDRLAEVSEVLLRRLEPVDGMLLYETFFTHVLCDEASVRRFCERMGSPRLGIVLDPPNFMTPGRYAARASFLDTLFEGVWPYVGMVHFKDYARQTGGDWPFTYPGPGQGEMDYPRLLRLLDERKYEGYGIIEHVEPEGYGEALRFVGGVG